MAWQRFLAVFVGGILFCSAAAGSRQNGAVNYDQSLPEHVVTDADLGGARCISGMEKFLPGDYFYCLAAQNYGIKHFAYSRKFFLEAAAWASKPAEYVLGIMAFNSDQQPADHALGLAWLELAAERHTPRFVKALADYTAKASSAEIQRSHEIEATLVSTYGDEAAARRAERRYRAGMAALRVKAAAASYCMEGQLEFRDLAGEGGRRPRCAPTEQVVRYIDQRAENVFEDWKGHVSVGQTELIRAPD